MVVLVALVAGLDLNEVREGQEESFLPGDLAPILSAIFMIALSSRKGEMAI